MTHRRSLSWSAALRDLRADRITIAPEERRAYSRREIFAKIAAKRALASAHTRPLADSSGYDRRAIMSAAIISAKARRTVTGEPWNICLSAALRGTWQAAKEARRFAQYQEQHNAQRAKTAPPLLAARSTSGADGYERHTGPDRASPPRFPKGHTKQSPKLHRSDALEEPARFRPATVLSTFPAPR
ncbi:hypothetical protein [Methylobacterium nigriterrae]|uniref:hypothetical protein n=1 Tax=Methylobacterium nigriterrae TaxID=3127512 RepID=UPI003013269D